MATRDPDRKRQQLMEAALAEFAEYGVAGARVDRLAKRAGISPGLVYSFFAGKEGLFEAVYEAIVEQTVDAVPIDADDLPEYAGRLHDTAARHPQVMRFLAWYALERAERPVPEVVARSMDEKITAIEAAQRSGTVRSDKPAGEVLALVLALANMWQHQGEDVGHLVTDAQRRSVITDAVRRLVTP
ncbi:TetR family transcriptional regulator [Actinorugispora endophytica]|uniref:TetR family transcriptional regulator n=1 Tax=Actinorugispora endophytica TaxID=1605990 RepID=A0A4R6V6A5_9ACTN|nr:TetR family transcriptional regulator [Actinorugispora endophytica]TDQ54418.1 TetR family transcriptional regulator [Actinorugispora endophytica]